MTELAALVARIASRARRFGSISWSEFMELALYDPDGGFYQSGGAAGGRGGDFVTSPEIGPLFARVWALALDRWWEEMGRPDPFVVVEAAAGTGTLARDILAARPACAPALRYVLVERSAPLRAAQAGRLPLELPAFVLGPVLAEDPDDDTAPTMPGTGPLVTSLAELPAVRFTGVVLANELIDNLPVDLLEWRDGRWHQVRVTAADDGRDRLVEVLVPATPAAVAAAQRLVTSPLREGARVPLQRAAAGWLRQALNALESGRVVLIDYAAQTDDLARTPWTRWLRTFRQHQAGLSPLEAAGSQDLSCVVAVDQLAAVRPPTSERSQAEWLAANGVEDLAEAARVVWRERGAVGDLPALTARSLVHQAQALTEPAGLGGLCCLEWVIGRQSG